MFMSQYNPRVSSYSLVHVKHFSVYGQTFASVCPAYTICYACSDFFHRFLDLTFTSRFVWTQLWRAFCCFCTLVMLNECAYFLRFFRHALYCVWIQFFQVTLCLCLLAQIICLSVEHPPLLLLRHSLFHTFYLLLMHTPLACTHTLIRLQM